MTEIANQDDQVLPFQLDKADVRGRIARLDGVLNQILQQHDYPEEVSAQVAEAAIITALIGQTIDIRWKLSVQIRGDGPLRIVATDYYGPQAAGEPAKLRAWASYDPETLPQATGTGFEKIGKGMFAILIDQGDGMKPYQGITALGGKSLSDCAEAYFAQSEQLPTRFRTLAGQSKTPAGEMAWRAGGIMLQHMPKASPSILQEKDTDAAPVSLSEDDQENWNRVNILLDTVEETELVGPFVSKPQLLLRLFHEESPRIFEPQKIEFGCTCSSDKVRQTMSIYSAKDIQKMTTPEGTVTADCQFCGEHYVLDPQGLGFEAKKDS